MGMLLRCTGMGMRLRGGGAAGRTEVTISIARPRPALSTPYARQYQACRSTARCVSTGCGVAPYATAVPGMA
eukprot:2963345-Rhodomonas_salina.1